MSLPTPPTSKPRILALDLSLTATGVAMPDGDTLTIKSKLHGVERLAEIRSIVIHLAGGDTDLAVIESYSFGSPNRAHHLGELGGVIRLALWDAAIPYVDVTPSQRMKYASGLGAKPKGWEKKVWKAHVMAELNARTGRQIRDDNQADAYALRLYALDAYGWPEIAMPATHRDALNRVTDWPELTGAAR